MSKATRESLFTIAYVVVGLIAVMAVGYLCFGDQFFHFRKPDGRLGQLLPFIVVGLFGALMYASAQMRGAGLTIVLLVLHYAAQVLTAHLALRARPPRIHPSTYGAAAIIALPLGFALLAGSYAQKALGRRLKVGRFVVMGLIVAAGYGLMMLLWLIRSHVDIQLKLILRQALMGLELGAAMGLGFELVDLIGPRPKHQQKPLAPNP